MLGIHSYMNGVWTLESYLQNDTFYFLSASANLMVTSSTGISKINSTNIISNISDPLISNPLVAMEDGQPFGLATMEMDW